MTNSSRLPSAVIFDRDGTLIVDVPYNGNPARVRAMPTAKEAVDKLRAAHIPIGVISNQSGVGRGILTLRQVAAVNRAVNKLLGPFDVWKICPHTPEAHCSCRKPAPGMIIAAAASLNLAPADLAVIGDIGIDIQAATAVGARSVLVPTAHTLTEECDTAPLLAENLLTAVEILLDQPPSGLVAHERTASREGVST